MTSPSLTRLSSKVKLAWLKYFTHTLHSALWLQCFWDLGLANRLRLLCLSHGSISPSFYLNVTLWHCGSKQSESTKANVYYLCSVAYVVYALLSWMHKCFKNFQRNRSENIRWCNNIRIKNVLTNTFWDFGQMNDGKHPGGGTCTISLHFYHTVMHFGVKSDLFTLVTAKFPMS